MSAIVSPGRRYDIYRMKHTGAQGYLSLYCFDKQVVVTIYLIGIDTL